MGMFVVFFLLASSGCKKDGQLQPSWWDKLWHDETVIMKDLNWTHTDIILPKIDQIRTSLDPYVMWGNDTIQIYGPGGYEATANKAWQVWLSTYQQKLMPDIVNPPTTGELAKIIHDYLELRRDNGNNESFKKLWLCIPKELYEQDERFWEFFLSTLSTYLTVNLGGPNAWTNGTRDINEEKKLYYLPTVNDAEDPWGYNLPAQTRITLWYVGYAEGDNDKIAQTNYQEKLEIMRNKNAEVLYERYLNIPNLKFDIGSVENYKTKLMKNEKDQEYYVLGLPAVEMHQ